MSNCAACVYWVALGYSEEKGRDRGKCARFPPVYRPMGDRDCRQIEAEKWSFPQTYGCDWCGEFERLRSSARV
jgi:hypothetical protein